MFYFFSKTLYYLLTPAGWLVGLLVLALLTKKPARRRWLTGAGLAVFWLFGNSVFMNELALQWEYPPAPVPTDAPNRVAVLLTGGMVNTMKEVPDNRFLLGREADRAGQALYLYKVGAVRTILISGGSGDLPFQKKDVNDEGQMIRRLLLLSGVRPEDIVLEGKSRNTHENALFSARVLRERFHTDQCVLVTSATHMRRAAACFRNESVRVSPFPGVFVSSRRSFEPGDFILPHEQTFSDAYYLSREVFGYLVYWVMGYV